MEQLQAKYREIERALKSEQREASFRESFGALKDLGSILVEAKRAQVEALNHTSFSVEEYEWVRQQVYAAVGIAAARFDVKDVHRVAQQAAGHDEGPAAEIGDTPARNKELVKAYEKKLQGWAPLAFFGL